MSDRTKKPKNYKRGRCLEFQRICREERKAGETVVVARAGSFCSSPFPCLADIYVYAGLDSPCDACAPNLQQMRDLHGWERRGEFWISKDIAPEQRRMVEARIEQRAAREGNSHACSPRCGGHPERCASWGTCSRPSTTMRGGIGCSR